MSDIITITVDNTEDTAVVTIPAPASVPVLVVTQEVLVRDFVNATLDGGIIN